MESQMDSPKVFERPWRDIHRHARRVHIELLDQFIVLTKSARNSSSNDFLRDSLDDQIEWLSDLKASYPG